MSEKKIIVFQFDIDNFQRNGMNCFDIKIGSKYLRNMMQLNVFNDDMLAIYINSIKIEVPLFLAVSISTKVVKLLQRDDTLREISINMNFRKINNRNMIINMIKTHDFSENIVFDSYLDYLDFAEFGAKFGIEEFIEPLRSNINKFKGDRMTVENIIDYIEEKSF